VLRAEQKAWQLEVAAALGFDMPPTLITNSPEAFLAFYREHDGQIISKPIHNGIVWEATETQTAAPVRAMAYTTLVTPRDVGYAAALRYCPTIVQAYVPKHLELRITVVGQQVFACEIHSQHTHHTRHDWRRYDLSHTPHRPHALPEPVRQLCLQLVARLGLCYGAIDMVLTPEGRYVFLEINPNGQFAWIEDLAGLPISEALCDLLMTRTATTVSASGQTQCPWAGELSCTHRGVA
jgi:glutathione synthase/RimK-type ligase-like ATP-grasp enzyme